VRTPSWSRRGIPDISLGLLVSPGSITVKCRRVRLKVGREVTWGFTRCGPLATLGRAPLLELVAQRGIERLNDRKRTTLARKSSLACRDPHLTPVARERGSTSKYCELHFRRSRRRVVEKREAVLSRCGGPCRRDPCDELIAHHRRPITGVRDGQLHTAMFNR